MRGDRGGREGDRVSVVGDAYLPVSCSLIISVDKTEA